MTISRFFESDILAWQKLSYPTALKATNLIRQAIATESKDYEFLLKGEVEADESDFGGHRKGKRGRGSIVYTDKFRCYDSLMFCGYRHLKIDHSRYFSSGKVYINGLEGFWSFAKERLMKYHGSLKKNSRII